MTVWGGILEPTQTVRNSRQREDMDQQKGQLLPNVSPLCHGAEDSVARSSGFARKVGVKTFI